MSKRMNPRSLANLQRGGPGRPKGSQEIIDIKKFAKELFSSPEYRLALEERLRKGKAPHIEKELLYYAFGKPREVIEFTGTVTHEYRDRFNEIMAAPALKDMALGFANRLSNIHPHGNGAAT